MAGVMIQTALLVSAILAIQKVLGDKLHAYVRYGLWLLVAARLLLPVNFIDSSFSMLHIAEAAATQFEQRINNHEDVTGGQLSSDIAQQEMLMYGKEASNRKQEIDRQHYTIPNQRPKDKHCGKI